MPAYISAWASALLVQTVMGNAKASECRDGQQVQTPALFLYVTIHYFFNQPAPGARRQKKTEKAMKTIIAISGQGNIGKTHAIIEIARRFPMEEKKYFNCYTKEPVAAPDEGLVLCCGKYSTGGAVKTIGFSSEGDTQEPVNNALDVFLENNETEPDVLVMACRSKGDSVFAIRKFATEHGYNVIWTSNYCGRTYGCNGFEGEACAQFPNGTDLNGIFAENIVSLINKLLS